VPSADFALYSISASSSGSTHITLWAMRAVKGIVPAVAEQFFA
jgi:hypothetical protein